MTMTRTKLRENVYLTYIPAVKFKTCFLSAQFLTPLRADTAGYNALLCAVLDRGCRKYPDMERLSAALDLLYGANIEHSVRKRGENQLWGFVATCIDESFLPEPQPLLEPLGEILGEIICHPVLEDGLLKRSYVESERTNLLDAIRSVVNDKRSLAGKRLLEEMCAGEPYGLSRLGTAKEVERISLQKLNSHYQAILPRARLELFYCGSIPAKRVAGAFTRAFAALPRQGAVEPAITTRRAAPEECRVVEETMDVSQGKLCIGFRTDSTDMPAMLMVNNMFGGTSNSKLFLNVREKLSLCYYAGSTYHRAKGLVTVSSGIEAANYDRAVAEIMAQLEALRGGRWEDWEFEGARSSLRNSLCSMEDSAGALEDYALSQAAAGSDETIPLLLEAVSAVTEERVRQAAASVRPDTIYFLKGKEA